MTYSYRTTSCTPSVAHEQQTGAEERIKRATILT